MCSIFTSLKVLLLIGFPFPFAPIVMVIPSWPLGDTRSQESLAMYLCLCYTERRCWGYVFVYMLACCGSSLSYLFTMDILSIGSSCGTTCPSSTELPTAAYSHCAHPTLHSWQTSPRDRHLGGSHPPPSHTVSNTLAPIQTECWVTICTIRKPDIFSLIVWQSMWPRVNAVCTCFHLGYVENPFSSVFLKTESLELYDPGAKTGMPGSWQQMAFTLSSHPLNFGWHCTRQVFI